MKTISDILTYLGIAMCCICLTASALNSQANPWLILGACGSLACLGAAHSIRKTIRDQRDRLD